MTRRCPTCGFSKKRVPCECCRRLEQWERKPAGQRLKMFPPLVQQNLTNLSFPKIEKAVSYYIFGPAGTGKTMHACDIAYQLMRRAVAERTPFPDVLFIDVPNLLFEIRSTYGKDKEISEKQVILKYMQCGWLILDDLGAEEKNTDWTYQILYLIINTRYLNSMPMIITSNYSLEQISKYWNDNRISQRIMEHCKLIKKTKSLRMATC